MSISEEMAFLWRDIRNAWRKWSPNRRKALDAVMIKLPKKKKDGTDSKVMVKHWICADCGKPVTERDVDHRLPVGKAPRCDEDVGKAAERLFCELANLQILCKICHKRKSSKEKAKGYV